MQPNVAHTTQDSSSIHVTEQPTSQDILAVFMTKQAMYQDILAICMTEQPTSQDVLIVCMTEQLANRPISFEWHSDQGPKTSSLSRSTCPSSQLSIVAKSDHLLTIRTVGKTNPGSYNFYSFRIHLINVPCLPAFRVTKPRPQHRERHCYYWSLWKIVSLHLHVLFFPTYCCEVMVCHN